MTAYVDGSSYRRWVSETTDPEGWYHWAVQGKAENFNDGDVDWNVSSAYDPIPWFVYGAVKLIVIDRVSVKYNGTVGTTLELKVSLADGYTLSPSYHPPIETVVVSGDWIVWGDLNCFRGTLYPGALAASAQMIAFDVVGYAATDDFTNIIVEGRYLPNPTLSTFGSAAAPPVNEENKRRLFR